MPAQAPVAAAPERIPDGKGSTTGAGKFVPAAVKEDRPAVSPAQVEKQLREALKVEETAPGKFRIGSVKFDAANRTVSLPAKVKPSPASLSSSTAAPAALQEDNSSSSKAPALDRAATSGLKLNCCHSRKPGSARKGHLDTGNFPPSLVTSYLGAGAGIGASQRFCSIHC